MPGRHVREVPAQEQSGHLARSPDPGPLCPGDERAHSVLVGPLTGVRQVRERHDPLGQLPGRVYFASFEHPAPKRSFGAVPQSPVLQSPVLQSPVLLSPVLLSPVLLRAGLFGLTPLGPARIPSSELPAFRHLLATLSANEGTHSGKS